MMLEISEELAQRLQRLAQQKNTSVGELLVMFVDQYESPPPRPGSLAELAQVAREAAADLKQKIEGNPPSDTAARSREILDTEFADYLKRRRDE